MSTVSIGFSKYPVVEWLRQHTDVKTITECRSKELAYETKVFVNGEWAFMVQKPFPFLNTCKLYRRNGFLPFSTNFSFDIAHNEIHVHTDAGRLIRPIFYIDHSNRKLSYDRRSVRDQLNRGQLTWEQIVTGLSEQTDTQFSWKANRVYKKKPTESQVEEENLDSLKTMQTNQAILDYIDVAEEQAALIATTAEELPLNPRYTHIEIDPSLILGVMGNAVVYPEHNPSSQNALSCVETREAVSVYHSNHSVRMDPTAFVLHYGQTPLIKSRYLEFVNNEEQPYGVNAMVAIMSYTGYNTASAIIVNQGSIDRGMFATTCYSSYEGKEECQFMHIGENQHIVRKKKGYNYGYLDQHGIIRNETRVDDKMILIGKTETALSKPKKGQTGFVDKTFVTLGEEGSNVAKVRIRDFRTVQVGDKMASRSGLKGVVGVILPEDSMPFMQDGLCPDIIINPHALPSHMNVGQLIESLFGLTCASYGAYGDCTAFQVKGANYHVYGPLLTKAGFHHTGNHVLYNGCTGEQIQANVFMGPTYYMRSRHMVADKTKFSSCSLERDAVCAHGMAYFLNESYLVRGDEYYMAICNKTGAISVYNSEINVFLSPFADGPLQFHASPTGNLNLKTVSKHGRSFSLLRVPRAFKMLIQELQVMNIQMRLVTDANVDQLMSMTFSHNISRLLQIPDPKNTDELKEMVDAYVKTIAKSVHPASKSENHRSKPVIHDEEFVLEEDKGEKETTDDNPSEEDQQLSQALTDQLSEEQSELIADLNELSTDQPLIIKKPEQQDSQSKEEKEEKDEKEEKKTVSILEVQEENKEDGEKDNNEDNKDKKDNDTKTITSDDKQSGGDSNNIKKVISFSDDTKPL
jgi:DNA-directed RNA polymerase beta subunit